LKFGIGLPTGMEGLINPIPFFRADDFVTAAQVAERLEYDSVWGNDHYAAQEYVRQKYREPPNFYEVLTVLTAVAAVTNRVELGTCVLVLPMRDIVSVARQVATLDRFSRGRVLLGVGIGAYKEEYAAARPDLLGKNRGKILEEGLDVLTKLYRDGPTDHAGKHYRISNLHLAPRPYRDPFPILVGGHSRVALDRAVRYGSGWIPGWRPFDELREWIEALREKAAGARRDPSSLIVAPQLSCLVARTQEEAERRYMNSGMVQHRISLAYTGRDPSAALENNLVGSPDTLLEKLEKLHDYGVDHLACLTFCVESVSEYFDQLTFFAEAVMRPYRAAHGIEVSR
jgi:probable F420-dependent oxidoreductase